MSDRRFVTVLVAALVALVGAAMIALPLLELRDPVHATDEGRTADLSRVLVATIAFGALLVLAGVSTAVGIVRAQLRRHDRDGSGSDGLG